MIGANTLDWFSLGSRESTSPIFPGDMKTDDFTSGLPFPGLGTSPLDTAKFLISHLKCCLWIQEWDLVMLAGKQVASVTAFA